MKSLYYTILMTSFCILASCSNDEGEVRLLEPTTHTAILRLDGDIQHFDDALSTRAASSEWDDGAKLYIQYQTASGAVHGVATYDENSNEWSVDYYGAITRNATTACEVYYFENVKSNNGEAVELDYTSAVYADKEATYLYKDGVVYLKTHLMPQTGRIRFHGTPGYDFSLTGLQYHTNFNLTSKTLSLSYSVLNLTVGDDGYTPYLYTSFSDNSKKLSIDSNVEDYKYYTTFDDNVLMIGKSGFMDVPTPTSHNGWFAIEKFHFCPDQNHPHIIDMGEAGKWACCNIGSSNPLQAGSKFAWGETESKSSFYWTNYKWGLQDKQTKYNYSDGKTSLDPEDDAAIVNWGKPWRMPTTKELGLLKRMCSWSWVDYEDIKGCKITASNGNAIFLPCSLEADYWSSNCPGSPYNGYWEGNLANSLVIVYFENGIEYLGFKKGDVYVGIGTDYYSNCFESKYKGLHIRPISE